MSHSNLSDRSRIKQDALARLYGTGIDHHAQSPVKLTSPLMSPLDRAPSSGTKVNPTPKFSNKLPFIRKSDRASLKSRVDASISKLHKELAEKTLLVRSQQEIDSYSSYVQLMREDKQRKEATFRGQLTSEELLVDDTDIDGDELAKNEWELRELERIERDLAIAPQPAEEHSNEHASVYGEQAPKTKYRFLQKYYHQGAFFADDSDGILSRDYDLPTESDAVDKTALPEILQVRNFGKRSQSKWKHLSAEDTTSFDGYGWYQKNDPFAESMASRMAGQEHKRS
ncbi:hypothetical protein MDAP_001927 [Mitosporidium daphniae]